MPLSRQSSTTSAASDPGEAIFAARRPHLAFADDEEMGRVAGRDEAVRIEHQALVGARLGRLDRGEDTVQFRMRIELGVLHCRVAPADMDGEQPQALLGRLRGRLLIFRDDDDGRRSHHNPRVLVGRRAHAPGHHQPNVDAFAHVLRVERFVEPASERLARQADIHRDRLGALEQSVEMAVEEGDSSLVDPQALPHPVAEHEAGIEHRDGRLGRAASAHRSH